MATECFYKVLNIVETATQDEIKKSYRQLSMKWHPDKNPDNQDEAKAKFQKINEAYETLSDPEKRQMYDLEKNNPLFNRGGANNINMNDINNIFANLFNPFSNGMGGLAGGIPGGMPNGFPQGGSFQFQGGPGIRIFTTNNFPSKPQPIQLNISISIEQVLTSTTIPIEIERSILENNIRTTEKETLYIPVPKGIADGEIIVLQDKGNVININGQVLKGEVKIFVKVENKTLFKRNGLDLIYDKKITLKEALCGFTFELKHLNGKSYTINNNAGSIINPGYKKVIPNMGLPRDEYIGNLIICFEIQFPEKLSEETVKKLNEIL